MCIEDAYLNEVLLPGFLQSGMPTSLYDALERARPAARPGPRTRSPPTSRTRRGGRAARGRARRRRCCGTRAAALAGEKVVEVSRSVYRADRFTLWVQLGQEG